MEEWWSGYEVQQFKDADEQPKQDPCYKLLNLQRRKDSKMEWRDYKV